MALQVSLSRICRAAQQAYRLECRDGADIAETATVVWIRDSLNELRENVKDDCIGNCLGWCTHFTLVLLSALVN